MTNRSKVRIKLFASDFDKFCEQYGNDIIPFDTSKLITEHCCLLGGNMHRDMDIVYFGWDNIKWESGYICKESIDEFFKTCINYAICTIENKTMRVNAESKGNIEPIEIYTDFTLN